MSGPTLFTPMTIPDPGYLCTPSPGIPPRQAGLSRRTSNCARRIVHTSTDVNLSPVLVHVPLARLRERSDVRLDKIEEDPVCVTVDVESVGNELRKGALLASRVAQGRAVLIEILGQRGGFLRDGFVQVNQDDLRHGGGYLPGRLRVSGADGSLTSALLMPSFQIELGQADLVQRRRRDQQDCGFVRRDALVGDDLGQVLLVLLDRDALVVCGEGNRSVVRP